MSSLHVAMDKDFHWLLKNHAERRPDAPMLHWEPFEGEAQTWTYGVFYKDVRRCAAGLHGKGVRRGDFVLLHANNCPEFLIAYHACAALGAVVVTTNPRSAIEEMRYFISHSRVRFAITQPEFVALIRETGPDLEWIASTERNSTEPSGSIPDGIVAFHELFADDTHFDIERNDPMAPLSVQYTSGTTSRPKGVVWTHANALWGSQTVASHNLLRDIDTAIVFTPLCHTNAMSWAHYGVLWSGGAMVLQPKFSASRFWPAALKHGCTWANVIPFAMQALATLPVPEDHAFRYWVIGAANIGPAENLFRVTFVGAWGMTELIAHGTYTPPQLSSPERSMGMPAPEFELKIVDDNGQDVAQGETGLLKVRGVPGITLFKEYLYNPEATAGSFDEEGWFDTGDRVFQTADGHLRFADRAKDMLKVGAENVAASEIEGAVMLTEGVLECAVVGKPDKMKDEVPAVFVRAAEASDALASAILETCRAQLADFKVPVEVIFVDDFPRAELNKIAKAKLRKHFAD
ncbi:AMP-binding protein [uncultured Hyphomonas sp.]|uniref:AMP-binding protein n=1 Tax=uncultured Hyphomonas sp. TaxID=225298 RepID=UPI002AAA8C23|nr:AMP-binding protein [uncultured Hyphomonas sp.]